MDACESVPVRRRDLRTLTQVDLAVLYPDIKFDYSYMDRLEREDLWFIDILTNEFLKGHLNKAILTEDPNEKKKIKVHDWDYDDKNGRDT